MKRLFSYIKPYGWFILLTVAIKFLATVSELFIPSLMETMIDEKVPGGQLSPILILGSLMLLCAGLSLGGNILANRLASISAGRITQKLRHDLFSKLENLSARQMDELTVSSAISRLTSDSYNFNQMVARIQRMGIRAPILLVGGVMMMLALGAAAIVFAPAETRWTVMLPCVLFTLGFSLIGLADDVIKAVLRRPEGLRAWHKIAL